MLERYVYKNQKKMRCGYTTGTCAAAAAKAAAQMLLSGRKVTEVSVRTPSDITLTLPVCEIQMKAHAVSCAVQKDSGDDPDITNKILIFAEVSYIYNSSNIITGDVIARDSDAEDATYFRTLSTEKEKFGFKKDEKNDYQLVISFPKEYDSFEYQGIVEGIKIVIESRQVIDNGA